MLTTFLIGSLCLLLLATICLWAFFLRVGLHLAKVEEPALGDICKATALALSWCVIVVILDLIYTGNGSSLQVELLTGLIQAIGQLVAIQIVFRTSAVKTLVAWLPTILSALVMSSFVILVFNPFIFKSYKIQAGSMSPTLRGVTRQSECPTCKSVCTCTALSRLDRWNREMICENFHVTMHSETGKRTFPADRVMVAKFLSPRRWDLVVFKFPEDPNIEYVMRLVGLPGESIHIENGVVYADNQPLELPSHLVGLNYANEIPNYQRQSHASKGSPAQLANDEYFVLGDFTLGAMDSRFWEVGAPGHNPFAVPESHLNGIITHIYWPSNRMRSLR